MNLDFILVLVIVGFFALAIVGLLVWRHLVSPLRQFSDLETHPAHVVAARVRVAAYEALRGSLQATEIGVTLTYWGYEGPERTEVWAEPSAVPAAIRSRVLGAVPSGDARPPRTDPTPIVDPTGEARAAAEDAARKREGGVRFDPPLEASVFLSEGRVVSWELTKGRGWHLRG